MIVGVTSFMDPPAAISEVGVSASNIVWPFSGRLTFHFGSSNLETYVRWVQVCQIISRYPWQATRWELSMTYQCE